MRGALSSEIDAGCDQRVTIADAFAVCPSPPAPLTGQAELIF
jgi:hypothetical protein